jgi:hypothetical protein
VGVWVCGFGIAGVVGVWGWGQGECVEVKASSRGGCDPQGQGEVGRGCRA